MKLDKLSSESDSSGVESGRSGSGSDHEEVEGHTRSTINNAEQQLGEQPDTEDPLPAPLYATVLDEDDPARATHIEMIRLLRGRRYFDEQVAETPTVRCFKCGVAGHVSRNCTSEVSIKPCYLCATQGHDARDCPHRVCFKCGKTGHISRDCSNAKENETTPSVCLRCGRSDCAAAGKGDYYRYDGGCTKHYSTKDLNQVRCYSCGSIGHLSCKPAPTQAAQMSCVFCGSSLHYASDCPEGLPVHLEAERRGDRIAAANAVTSYFGSDYSQRGYRDRDASPFQRGGGGGASYGQRSNSRYTDYGRPGDANRRSYDGGSHTYGNSRSYGNSYSNNVNRFRDGSNMDRRNSFPQSDGRNHNRW